MPQISNIRRRRRGNYFNQSGRYFSAMGSSAHVNPNPFAGGVRGAATKSLTRTVGSLGSLGDEEIDFEVICTANPNDPNCLESGARVTAPPSADADPQTAYTACLKGGGSFASCNQIPGVTPQMILAAKAGKLLGGGPSPSIGKTVVIVAAAGLALYLLTR